MLGLSCRHKASNSQAQIDMQQNLSMLVSQQEVELHAARLASDRAARLQSAQKQELAEALTQVKDLTQEVAALTR